MTPPTIIDRSQNTYDPLQLQHQEDLATARRQIKNAFQACMFIGGMTTFLWLALVLSGKEPGWSLLLFFNAVFFFGTGYGISRYNQACAKVAFGYFLLDKIVQVCMGQFPIAGIFVGAILLKYLWDGIIGTDSYNDLMSSESEYGIPVAVATTLERTRSPEPPKAPPTPSQPLNPTPELLALCGGDRSQAQWLLSQLKIKHPGRSPEWYDRQAIKQLTPQASDPVDPPQNDEKF
ncbi:hypothetical protein [Chamaesiphon minutus]|uniref:Uncharacterized protein n=1 Tax=Chamaesiphon minutus (strain ATCC 27169 / PCC 6605) TaxID=1173020 RepID=K9UDI7_CHAP6|nr:hypothetical protein [Chamaesiphon minutus]AFY92259.1 hypothetical protein Cha6605_1022 [Chamaesiphon minutus PCC 6605]